MIDTNDLFDKLKDYSYQEEAIEFLYVSKSWQKLSNEYNLAKELTFDNFYSNKIFIDNLIEIFNLLSNDFKLFSFYNLDKTLFTNDEITQLLSIVKNYDLPNVNDSFYNQRLQDFSVSNQIAELGIKLLDNLNDDLYVPFTNGFAYANFTNQKIFADFPSKKALLVSEIINILENKKINFSMTDSIEEPTFIDENAPHLLKQFSCVLSFPPLRLLGKIETSKDKFNRFKFQNTSILDIAHFEHILAQTEHKACVLMSVGFTYKGNFEEKFRKYLIEQNYLESIVQLPPNLFTSTSVETTIFVINKKRADNKVFFLNLKHNSFLTRNGKKMVLKNIDTVIEKYRDRKNIDDISILVDNEQIIDNNYSFAIDRYVINEEQKNLKKLIENYELIPLEKIAEAKRSQLFKDEEKGLEVNELSPSDFSKAGFTLEKGKIKQIGSQEKKLKTYQLEPYDVLLTTKGVIGKVAIVGEISKPMIASQAIQVIRILEENKKDKAISLYMFLKSQLAQTILFSLVGGESMPQISPSEIKQLNIPLLSKEQENELIKNFEEEKRIYSQIEDLYKSIEKIHSEFLKN